LNLSLRILTETSIDNRSDTLYTVVLDITVSGIVNITPGMSFRSHSKQSVQHDVLIVQQIHLGICGSDARHMYARWHRSER